MASREFWDVQGGDPETKILTGKITLTTSGNVSSTDSKDFASASHSSGAYTITLNDNYQKLLFASATLEDASNMGFFTLKTDSVTTGSVVFNHVGETTNAFTVKAASSGDIIHVMLVVKNVAD